jgi:Xaa-Pro dipeptidase
MRLQFGVFATKARILTMTVPESITRHYADHVARVQATWEHALSAENFDAAVIHSGSQIISFMDDYHYPFRPNPHFLSWLPLTRHDESVLIVRPGEKPVLYFYQPNDYWYLPPADPEAWWADHFDVRPVREPGDWHMGIPVGREAYIGDAPAIADEQDLNPAGLINRVHVARTRKTPYELACIERAGRIGAAAHVAAEAAFHEGCSEFEIHNRYLQAGQMEDAALPYGNIVALNEHGAVLHYQGRSRQVPDPVYSFLIDGGATVNAYCSDITRTYADHDGEFADLIVAMDEMQQGLCTEMRAGVDYRDLHVSTHVRIAGILAAAGIIKVSAEEAVETGLSSVFYPHGLGHFLGLQTHDVAGLIDDDGTPIPRPEGHPFLRLTRVLEAGNVLTVEPGFYFVDVLLKKWRANGNADAINWDKVEQLRPYGGIRIEDNVVVTDAEPVNLTRRAFAEL